jgi:hypothetical protein
MKMRCSPAFLSLLAVIGLLAVASCRKGGSTGADANSGEPGSTGSSDSNAFLGLPVAIDLTARRGFDPAKVYTEESNGYPGCETPANVDYGWTPTGGCPATPIGTQIPLQSYCHIDPNYPVTWWQSNPPACGDHWPQPSHLLGVNSTPVPREAWVHSMEHGAVILGYNCPDGCDAALGILRQVVQARADIRFKVILTPDKFLPANTFAAVSWTWIYLFTEPELKTLVCFVDEHFDHGRENDKAL